MPQLLGASSVRSYVLTADVSVTVAAIITGGRPFLLKYTPNSLYLLSGRKIGMLRTRSVGVHVVQFEKRHGC